MMATDGDWLMSAYEALDRGGELINTEAPGAACIAAVVEALDKAVAEALASRRELADLHAELAHLRRYNATLCRLCLEATRSEDFGEMREIICRAVNLRWVRFALGRQKAE